MVTRREKWLQLLFGSQFKGVYHCILNHWFERHLDLPMRVRHESVENLFDCAPLPAFLENLEVMQQRRAAADNVENPAAGSAFAAIVRAEKRLGTVA